MGGDSQAVSLGGPALVQKQEMAGTVNVRAVGGKTDGKRILVGIECVRACLCALCMYAGMCSCVSVSLHVCLRVCLCAGRDSYAMTAQAGNTNH